MLAGMPLIADRPRCDLGSVPTSAPLAAPPSDAVTQARTLDALSGDAQGGGSTRRFAWLLRWVLHLGNDTTVRNAADALADHRAAVSAVQHRLPRLTAAPIDEPSQLKPTRSPATAGVIEPPYRQEVERHAVAR